MGNTAASAIKFLSTINTVTYLSFKSPRSPCNCKEKNPTKPRILETHIVALLQLNQNYYAQFTF